MGRVMKIVQPVAFFVVVVLFFLEKKTGAWNLANTTSDSKTFAPLSSRLFTLVLILGDSG